MTSASPGRDRITIGRPALELLAGDAGLPLHAAFDALPIGVLIVSPAGDRANAELRRIARVDERRPFDGRALERRLRPLERRGQAGPRGAESCAPRPVRDALAGEDWPARRATLKRGDGTPAIVRVTARPLELEDGPGAVVTVVDETAVYEVERLRDAFLGIVGHELRSPISSILAGAELLRDETLDASIRTELATDLGEEARRLHELVEQLVRLADLRQIGEAVSDEPTHLPHLVRSRITRWRTRQPRLQARVDVAKGGLPPVAGEAGYVAQVLDILIDNAVKYAGTETPVLIRIEPAGDVVDLHVLDEGPGFPTPSAGPLFGLFWRASHAGRPGSDQPAGNGIGLFVARSIIEALGGRIWATNRTDGGADVGFSLPVARD